jgi:SHS2 domain-containing protein
MGKYSFIDHTADVGIEVEASGKAELFTLAARGMFAVICDIEAVKPILEREVTVESNDLPGLLHEWLAELLYMYDLYFEIYKDFDLDFYEDGRKVKAVVRGEEADGVRHGVHGEIKNVTWCDYSVEETPGGGYFARVIFDL